MNRTLGALSAAVALGAAAGPVNAQSLFAPSGPVIGSPLGGGVLNNIGFGAGANTGFGSFNSGFNSRFILPMNANFNSQLASFNNQRGFNTNLLDYNARLAQFNADRTNTAIQFSRFNSALNAPAANFSTPNPQLFPSTANLITSNGTLINPSINPFAVNNSSSLGFNAFNTFNPVMASPVNFGSAGVPPTAQVQNIVRVTRPRPAYNPTLPNPPASLYPTAAQLLAATAPASDNVIHRSGWSIPWPYPPPEQRVPGGIYMMSSNQGAPVRTVTSTIPTASENIIHRSGWVIPWPYPPPEQRVPGGIYMMGAQNGSVLTGPVAVMRSPTAFGSGAGMTIMGARK